LISASNQHTNALHKNSNLRQAINTVPRAQRPDATLNKSDPQNHSLESECVIRGTVLAGRMSLGTQY